MKLQKDYYPYGYNPMHPAMDWCKVRKLVRAVLNGVIVPEILVWGETLLAGTHRLAANNLLEMLGHDARIGVTDVDDLADEDFAQQLKDAVNEPNYPEIIQNLWDEDA